MTEKQRISSIRSAEAALVAAHDRLSTGDGEGYVALWSSALDDLGTALARVDDCYVEELADEIGAHRVGAVLAELRKPYKPSPCDRAVLRCLIDEWRARGFLAA